MAIINKKVDWPQKLTYGDLLNKSAEKWAEKEALIFKRERITYRAMREQVDKLAKGLINLDIKRGEKVSLWLNNCPEWFYFFFALAKIGAVVIPVNTRFKPNELNYVVGQSDSSVLIIGQPYRTTNYYNILEEVAPEIRNSQPGKLSSEKLPKLKTVISVGENTYPGTFSYSDILSRAKKVSDEMLYQRESEINPDDLFNIIYTSGTTGFPKGVMHSHKMIANMRDATTRMEMNENDRILLYLPLFHVYGSLAGLTGACIKGASIVLMEAFDAKESLKLIDKEKVTILYGFDTMYFDMINHPDFKKFSMKSLRFALLPGSRHVAEFVRENLCPILNVSGMTEATSITTLSSFSDPDEKVLNTNGRPLPAFTLKIIDPNNGKTLSANEKGELCIKGHPIMLGYYNKEEETSKVLDEEGWLRTGDAAYLDEEGFLHFMGRYKDMIRVGGENVDPVEVEALLIQHPEVIRASVVAAPDPRLSEVCFAFVQLVENSRITEKDIINYCKERVAGFKVPRGVKFINEFPMTPTGKIQKFLLREQARKIIAELVK